MGSLDSKTFRLVNKYIDVEEYGEECSLFISSFNWKLLIHQMSMAKKSFFDLHFEFEMKIYAINTFYPLLAQGSNYSMWIPSVLIRYSPKHLQVWPGFKVKPLEEQNFSLVGRCWDHNFWNTYRKNTSLYLDAHWPNTELNWESKKW
jgi:hypothetical protein